MLPGTSFLVAALVCGALVLALVGLIREVRGVIPDPTRPPNLPERIGAALRSPKFGARVGAAVLLGVATLVLTRWPVAAAGVVLLVIAWPKLFGGSRAEQQSMTHLEALVVFTETLRDTIAAHASLEQAIPAAAGNAPMILRPALVRLIGQVRARVPLDKALLALAAELNDPSADLVIAALILNVRRRGDRLGEVLTGLAAAAREELEMRRKVSAGRVEIRRGVQIVIAVTVAMALFLAIFSRGYVAPYSTITGQIALACIVGIFTGGFLWLRNLSSQAPVAPFLARPGQLPDPADTDLVIALTAGTNPRPSTRGGQLRGRS